MTRQTAQVIGGIAGAVCGFMVVLPVATGLSIVGVPLYGWPLFVVAILISGCSAVVFAIWGRRIGKDMCAYTMLQCQQCGYALRGTTGDACPECGQSLSAEQKRYRASWLYGIREGR